MFITNRLKTNMASLKEVVALYQNLTQEWNKKPPNLEKCGELLTKLKIGLTGLSFLPTQGLTASKQELLVARDILEIGAQWSIAVKDVDSFVRYIAQLKCYYLDYRDDLPVSAFKYQLLGLNLLRLLAQNKLSDFHTELELLPPKELHQNLYIKHPVSIEQYLMEGSYNKVFLARGNVPAESYNFFMDILLQTIRDEIAGCMERAYERLAFTEAARMLFFETQKQMKAYADKRGWLLQTNKFFYFQPDDSRLSNEQIPSAELAERAIHYAKELEMIV